MINSSDYSQDQVGLQSALTDAGYGGLITINGSYALTSQLVFPDDLTILGNAAFDCSTLTGRAIILGSRLRWHGRCEAFGATVSAGDSAYILMSCSGTDNAPFAPTYKKGPYFTELVLHDIKGQALLLEYVEDYHIEREEIYNIGYAGHIDISCRRGYIGVQKINGNNPPGEGNNAYGYGATRCYGNLTAYPRTCDIKIMNADYANIPIWHGFDTHAAERIFVNHLKVRNCKRAVAIGSSKDENDHYSLPSQNITILNPDIDEQANVSETQAFFITGASYGVTGGVYVNKATGIRIGGGSVRGYGMSQQSTAAIWCEGAEVEISDLFVTDSKTNCVMAAYGADVRLHNVTLRDPHDFSVDPSYIRMTGNGNKVTLSGNTRLQRRNTGLDTKVGKYAINLEIGNTGNSVLWENSTQSDATSGNTGSPTITTFG